MRSPALHYAVVLILMALAAVLWWAPEFGLTDSSTPTAPQQQGPAKGLDGHKTDRPLAGSQATGPRTPAEASSPRRVAHTGPTFTVRGHVLTRDDLPPTGAQVLAFAGKPGDRAASFTSFYGQFGQRGAFENLIVRQKDERPQLAATLLSEDGSFVLRDLGHRHLRIDLRHQFYGLDSPSILHLRTDQPQAHIVLRPYLGGHVIGRVTGLSNPAGTEVQLTAEVDMSSAMRNPRGFMGRILNSSARRTKLDGDGRFEFRAVPQSGRVRVLLKSTTHAGMSEPFPVKAGATRELILRATAAGQLPVRVLDIDHHPLAKARARLTPGRGSGAMFRATSAIRSDTDNEGRTTLQGLLPGSYELAVKRHGFVETFRKVRIRSGNNPEILVQLDQGGRVSGLVVDAEDQPVAGARIGVIPAMEVPMFGDLVEMAGVDVLAKAAAQSEFRSDKQGRFEITGLHDDQDFSLIATHARYGIGRLKDVRIGRDDLRLVMPKPTAIAGRVVDAAGKPIPEYNIKTLVTMALVLKRPSRDQQIQNDDGRFELAGVTAGRLRVQVNAEDFVRFEKAVKLKHGQQLDLGDIQLQPGAVIRGTVMGDNQQPIVGAEVTLMGRGFMNNPFVQAMSGVKIATTDRDGSFEMRGLAAGKLVLRATAKDYAAGVSPEIEVEAAKVHDNIRIQLNHGGGIRGKLLLPAGQSPVSWTVFTQTMTGANLQVVRPDPDGSFTVRNLAPGRYQVQAMDDNNLADWEEDQAEFGRPGKKFDFGKIMKRMQSVVAQKRCRVKNGQVTEVVLDRREQSGGSAGTNLRIRVQMGKQRLPVGFLALHTESRGMLFAFVQDGKANIDGVPPGEVIVKVRAGMTQAPVGEPQVIQVAKQDRQEVAILLPGGRLQGKVVDRKTGEVLEGALVRLLSHKRSQTEKVEEFGFAVSNSRGIFQFTGLGKGTYTLVANNLLGGADRGGRLEGVSLDSGQERDDLILEARAAARSRVEVRTPFGAPVARAMVLAVDDNHQPIGVLGPSYTGATGKAVLAGLPAGKVRVIAMADGWAPGYSELREARTGQATEFSVQLRRGPQVALHIKDKLNNPVGQVSLSARWDDGPWIPLSLLQKTDPKTGDIHLGELQTGQVTIRVYRPGKSMVEIQRAIPHGDSARLVLTLED